MTPLVFYYLFNESQAATILEEFQKFLTNTQLLCINDMDTSVEATMGVLPSMAFRKIGAKSTGAGHLIFQTYFTQGTICVLGMAPRGQDF